MTEQNKDEKVAFVQQSCENGLVDATKRGTGRQELPKKRSENLMGLDLIMNKAPADRSPIMAPVPSKNNTTGTASRREAPVDSRTTSGSTY